jgi:outer membrane receptor for ferrienterochelin and colicins
MFYKQQTNKRTHLASFQDAFFRTIISMALLLSLAAPLFAQAKNDSLRGRVTDATGAAIAGASVTLVNLSTGLERTLQADASGAYSFTGVRSERYRITASANGFAPETRELDANHSEVDDLKLEPAPLTERVTVVSGSRQEELRESLNTRVEVVGQARIRDTGYENVAEVLREVPGVVTRRGSETAGAAGEQIQGIDSRQILVLLDGQPIIGARGIKRGVLNLDRQSVGRLDRVEVVKGASSALYGSDAIGGVINMITREPSSPFEFALTTSGGNYGTFDIRADAGFAHDNLSGFFSVERHKNNGFDLTPTTFDTTGAGFHRYDALAKFKYQFTPSFALSVLANSYWTNQQGRSVGELGPQTSDVDEESQNYGLTADWQINTRTALQARGYFARFDEITNGRLAPPANLPLESGTLHERLGKVDATVSTLLGEHQYLQVGGEFWTNRYRGVNRLRDDGGNRADTRVLWAQDKISFANRATITLGFRYDNHSIFGDAVSPKAGVNIRITDGLRVRASYGRGFRAPDLGQLYYRFLNPTNFYQVIGNPNLKPEYANSWQVGSEYTTTNRRVRFGVNLFRNDVRDLIDSVSLGFIASPQQLAAIVASEGIDPLFKPQLNRLLFLYKNIADAATQGVEFDGDISLARGFLLGGAYTYLDAFDKATDLELLGRNRHQGHTRFAWESGEKLGLRANVRGTFYSSWINSRATVNGVVTNTVAPKFALWDFYIAKKLYRGLEVFTAVDNFTDSQDPNTGRFLPATSPTANPSPAPIYRPEVGRTFRVGMRWNFDRR